MSDPVLHTERLVLRNWTDQDLEPFAAINADPAVMRHFTGVKDRAGSDELMAMIRSHFRTFGFGLFAVERRSDGALLGFTGLAVVPFDAHFTPATEIGWRLGSEFWGYGYATEAAAEVVRFSFDEASLNELVSMAVPANKPSLAVMRRLGMRHDPADDFDHPAFPDGHRLRRHVLHRLTADDWRNRSTRGVTPIARGVV